LAGHHTVYNIKSQEQQTNPLNELWFKKLTLQSMLLGQETAHFLEKTNTLTDTGRAQAIARYSQVQQAVQYRFTRDIYDQNIIPSCQLKVQESY
jgi:hypothetical protein